MTPEPQNHAKSRKKKILIIDDEKNFLKITKLNLKKTERYEVMVLPSGKEVLFSVHVFLPDVILVDLLMPALGGLEVCEILN
jgi:CheY-like chemotaxis protein